MKKTFRGIRPDDLHGRAGLRNPERGLRTEMYFSCIPGEIAGMCSCHYKLNKLDGRPEKPVYQNSTIPGVPHLIRGNRLDGIEFSHGQWQDELDFLAYDGVTIMQSYCFLMKYEDGRDLPQEKLDDMEGFFLRLRAAGVKALLRFAYELSPSLNGPTAETTLKHLSQVTPLLRKYKDVIYVLQCGFIGKFGEWHNSFHYLQNDVAFHKELMSAVLESLPPERCTMMRYPALKMHLFGAQPLSADKAFTMAPEARIGHFNDGFLAGPPSHGGTFNRGDSVVSGEEEMDYLEKEGLYLPMDGELFWSDVGGMALPQNAATLFNRWSYDTFGMVHSHNLFEGADTMYSMDVWKRVPIDPMFILANNLPMEHDYFVDDRGKHVWRSYYEYIRDHLGYRIVLQEAETPEVCLRNEKLKANISLINFGFSSPVNPRPVYLTLSNGIETHNFAFDTDIRRWAGHGTPQKLSIEAELPDSMKAGKYRVGLAMPDGCEVLQNNPDYSIRCANPIEFKDGVNWLGMEINME